MQLDQDARSLPPFSSIFPYFTTNPAQLPKSLDPFTITDTSGFMPSWLPLLKLPDVFRPVTDLLEEMPIVKGDGKSGLLANYKLGPAVDTGALPDLTAEVEGLVSEDGRPDLAAVAAAFRDYSFLASAYLLEPCWETWSKDKSAGYGLGRQVLPVCIAGPLIKTAEM